MSTIFISHSSRDNDAAKEMARRLAEQDHPSVFLDLDPEKGIVGGESWERTLYRKLRACRAVVVLCTDSYLASHWCFAEIALARMEGKHILACLVDPLAPDAKLPSILTEKQFIDLRTVPEEGYQRLWRGLSALDVLGVSGEWDPKRPPYLGLSAYDEEHAPVFFGRDEESRGGVELLERGSPGLVMVLGASGSGKSSLARAGIVPRLRRHADRWLLVGPFRPRRDPFAELAEAFSRAYQRYAPEGARSAETRERLRALKAAGGGGGDADADGEAGASPAQLLEADERLPRLLQQLEELRKSPPEAGGSPLVDFLDWSLDDLRKICGERPPAEPAAEQTTAGPSALVDIADDLRRASGKDGARVLLVVDQFEELLGHDDAADAANRFLDLVRHSIEAEHTPLMAMGTMRSDFLGVFQRNRALLGIDFESLSVGPMAVEGMRRVIEEPAKLGAIELEKGLADSLLRDTETPDALPLLSFTLTVLWRGRENGRMSVRQYKELGGLHGAVAREAEAVLATARRQGKEDDVRVAFLQMARLTEDGRYARQPVSWAHDKIRNVAPIFEEFEKRRLLVTRMDKGEERTVEVAHEALFRSWAPLKTWLDDHRGDLLLQAQLRRDASAWEESGRAADRLWHGGRLEQGQELVKKGAAGAVESAFVRAGVRRRWLQRGLAAGITVAVFAVLTYFLVEAQLAKREALEKTIIAKAVGGKNLLSSKPAEGLVTVIESAARMRSSGEDIPAEVRSSFIEALQLVRDGGVERNAWVAHAGESVNSVALTGDGATLVIVTGGWDRKVRLWNGRGEPMGRPLVGHASGVKSVAVTANGDTIVSGSADGVRLWTRGGECVATLDVPGTSSVAVTPDGNVIARAGGGRSLWHGDGRPKEPYVQFGGSLLNRDSVAVSADGEVLVGGTWDKVVVVRDGKQKQLLEEVENTPDEPTKFAVPPLGRQVVAIASNDGLYVVSGGEDGKLRRWDEYTAPAWTQPNPHAKPTVGGHAGAILAVAISGDEETIVTGGEDGTVRLWRPFDGTPLRILRGHTGGVNGVAVSHNGSIIASAGEDGTVRLWQRRDTPNETLQPLAAVLSVVVDDEGRIATAHTDGRVLLWGSDGAAAPEPIGWQCGAEARAAALSPAAGAVALVLADGTVRVGERPGDLGTPLRAKDGAPFTTAALSEDGRSVAVGSSNGRVHLFRAGERDPVWRLRGHEGTVTSIGVSSNAETIVSGGDDGKVVLWNAADDAQPETLYMGFGSAFVAASSDGETIVSGGYRGMLRLWDGRGNSISEFKGHDGNVHYVAFHADRRSASGETLVTIDEHGTMRLWDPNGTPIGRPFHGHGRSFAMSPDGHAIVRVGSGQRPIVVRIDVATFLQEASDCMSGHVAVVEDTQLRELLVRESGWSAGKTATFLAAQGRALARRGDVEAAKYAFQWARRTELSIDLDPDTETTDSDVSDVARRLSAAKTARDKVLDGQRLARRGDRDGAIGAFESALQIDPTADLDPNTSTFERDPLIAVRQLALSTCKEGRRLAEKGDIEAAILAFAEAQRLEPGIDLDPESETIETRDEVAWRLSAPKRAEEILGKGQELAQIGDLDGAKREFERATEIDSTINLLSSVGYAGYDRDDDAVERDPNAAAKHWAAKGRVSAGESLAGEGKIAEAIAAYQDAMKLDSSVIDAWTWLTLARSGCQHGQAAAVLFACDNAVKLRPADPYALRVRAIARSLAGTDGAIEDLKAGIDAFADDEYGQAHKTRMQGWLDALKSGEDPFTTDEKIRAALE